jgi:pimeloyl-ACP methyl ester carboxylesterase
VRRLTIPSALALVLGAALGSPTPTNGSSTTSAPVAAIGSSARFVAMSCPAHTFPDRLDVDCGYVRVPQDRSDPTGRQIRVAAAVVHSESPDPSAMPILMLPGGPSAGAITRFSIRAYFSGASWAKGHDVVLVDTRGVGLSTPRLGCPEFDRAGPPTFYSGPGVASRAPRILGAALARCRHRLVSEGVSPEDYTVDESVADLEALRRALRIDQWNLMAVSADGMLGMSYVREHPSSIRSTIVDSGLSTQWLGFLDFDRGASQQLEKVFAGCAANAACRHRYPHVRRSFMRLVHRLQRRPRQIHFPDFRPHPVSLRLDGVGLYYDTVLSPYPGDVFTPEQIHAALDRTWRITHGELGDVYRQEFGTGPVTNDHSDRYVALGRSMSLECHDVHAFVSPAERRRAARDLPVYAARYLSRSFDLGDAIGNPRSTAGCRIWDVGGAEPSQHQPVVSDVPTLVLAGEYDLGVPAYIVRQNMVGLSRGTYIEFPAVGHQQLAYFNPAHRCARSIAAAFLLNPSAAPDTSCAAAMPAFDFTPPKGRSDPVTSARCRNWACLFNPVTRSVSS